MTRLRNQDGWVVVTATMLLAIMLMSGLALMAGIDTGQERSREHRERESAFNLTEGVLFNQAFVLAQYWPGGQNASYPARCDTATVSSFCPTPSSVDQNFTNVDLREGKGWVTRVRDNYGPMAQAYDPAAADGALTGTRGTCAAPCSRDFNGDRAVWVQARATAQGEPRTVVALMKLEQLQESMPQVAVASGAISVTNSSGVSDRPLVDGTGSDIQVRCPPDPPRPNGGGSSGGGTGCTSYREGQMTPPPQSGAPSQLMTVDQIARFREKAKILNTYYTGCPPENLTGEVVFVEACFPTSGQVWQSGGATTVPACNAPDGLKNTCTNRIDKPGLLIVKCGGMIFGGQWTYVGIIYFANNLTGDCPGGTRGDGTCSNGPFNQNDVMETRGGFGIWGVVAAEGPACMKFGSQGFQFRYDDAVFNALVSFGTVGLVQNTWRELPGNTGA